VSDAVAVSFAGASVRDSLREATAALRTAGCDTPGLDASLLLASVLGVERSRLIVDRDRSLASPDAARFGELVARRAAREPVAYILGIREFRRISLAVDSRVLIPRPETELLVEVGLAVARGAHVVDVGTGSGAVALALKDERPDLTVVGTDASFDAVTVARSNATRLGLDVRFECVDLVGSGQYDALLANLPYVADGLDLQPEIALYEPSGALFAGPDGLSVIRRLAASLSEIPLVALEIGSDQGDAVESLLAGAGYESIERLRDLSGHERVVVGRRRLHSRS
jgi:release factor glutamine methyltransferase